MLSGAAGLASVGLSGTVTNTVTGEPISGATVAFGAQTTSTAQDGLFRYELDPGSLTSASLLRLTGAGIVERALLLSLPGSRNVAIDAIGLQSDFDLAYYRRLVRDDFSSPGTLRSLRRWTQAPRVYVRTVDESGAPVDAKTIETAMAALQDDASAWTGGRFGLASIERGVSTREGVSGWLTVKWSGPPVDTSFCGRAQIATSGGWIELNHLLASCACGDSRIAAKTVRHELGHAMGFYHSGDERDVMWHVSSCDNRRPSARERLHAAVAYSRPIGNMDPDIDPIATPMRLSDPVVVVD